MTTLDEIFVAAGVTVLMVAGVMVWELLTSWASQPDLEEDGENP